MEPYDRDAFLARRRRRTKRLWLLFYVAAFLAVGVFLLAFGEWTEACITTASHIARIIDQYACSTYLLEGSSTDIALFVWLWSVPALLIGAIILRFVTNLRERMK